MKQDQVLATQSLSLHGQVDQICDAFEAAWRAGRQPDIGEFLASQTLDNTNADPAARQLLLHELIKIDLEHRWRCAARSQGNSHDRGTTDVRSAEAATETLAKSPCLLVGHYIELFPELGSLNDLPVELIAEEYRVRLRWGDRPSAAEYARRFPRHGHELFEALREVDAHWLHVGPALQIRVYADGQLVHSDILPSPVELGRQQPDESRPYCKSPRERGCRLVIASMVEDTVSRRHVFLELLPDGQLQVTNLSSSRSISLQSSGKLAAPLPYRRL